MKKSLIIITLSLLFTQCSPLNEKEELIINDLAERCSCQPEIFKGDIVGENKTFIDITFPLEEQFEDIGEYGSQKAITYVDLLVANEQEIPDKVGIIIKFEQEGDQEFSMNFDKHELLRVNEAIPEILAQGQTITNQDYEGFLSRIKLPVDFDSQPVLERFAELDQIHGKSKSFNLYGWSTNEIEGELYLYYKFKLERENGYQLGQFIYNITSDEEIIADFELE